MPQLTEWAAWANIIAVPIAVALSLWLYYRNKQKRALACEFQSIDFPIEVKAGKALEGDIEIHYKKRAVDNLFLVRFRLKNTGNLAIRKEHVVEPVRFTFGPDIKILRPPKLLDKKPKNLKTSWDDYTDLVSVKRWGHTGRRKRGNCFVKRAKIGLGHAHKRVEPTWK